MMHQSRKIFFSIGILILLFFSISFFITRMKEIGYGLTYQVTSSMPKGFYLLEPLHKIKRGEVVVLYPPRNTLNFMLKKHWIPRDGLLMKKVFAVPGEMVCKKNNYIWINGKRIAKVYQYYGHHQLLPQKKFCLVLPKNQYLLMSLKVSHSFDGRYFGPVDRSRIIAKGKKL